MDIGRNIKKIREAKGLSQKEVISAIDMGAAQYSRIENGKTEPSVASLERIAKALAINIQELFVFDDILQETNSYDKTTMEKVKLIHGLSEEEQKIIYSILDAFVRKKKLKSTLEDMLKDMK